MPKETLHYMISQIKEHTTNKGIFNLLHQSVPILVGIVIFFNAFPHTTAIKLISFYLSVFIVLILMCFKKTHFSFDSPLTLPFALFTIWAFFGLFFALDKENSIHDLRAHLLNYLALYYLLINFFNTRKRFEVLSWVIIVSAALFSIGGMINYYLMSGRPIASRFGLTFLELNCNYIGFVTLFALLLSLHHIFRETNVSRRVILIACFLGTFVATLLTQTRGVLGPAVVACIVLLFPRSKKTVIAFLILFVIGIGITPGLTSRFTSTHILKDPRIGINLTFYEVIKSYPITGIGFGMLTYLNKNLLDLEKYNARLSPQYRQYVAIPSPHNSWMDIAVRTGLVGFGLYLYILFMFVRMGWRIIRHGRDDFIRDGGLCLMAAFVGIFLEGLFADGMFGPQAIVLYTIFAMMTIIWRLDHPTPQASFL